MFRKVLIANRGEIALRIIRACRELGIKTVAVHSKADERSLHVHYADEAICIGPAASTDSYLNQANILSAAEITGAEAIHPGYGFLAENARFAQICKECHIKFIGPDSRVISLMGDKIEAKNTMRAAGVPVIPGSDGAISDLPQARRVVAEIGCPVIIKAAAGGGGRGMRLVHSMDELPNAFAMAQAEAEKAFGNPAVYIEKYFSAPRHVEVQVMADEHGNVVHLGERDCSIQRRHQKLVEESPCPVMTPRLREKIGKAAVRACRHTGYQNAGTIEFLLDENGEFYFMEMNTRIQVEHPVTEMVTNVDLIKEQILVAAGERLSFRQSDIEFRGHAIECRINAEDPARDFAPCPGRITVFNPPGGPWVRVDTHCYTEYMIPPNYDSMIAKLITWGRHRDEALARMRRALEEFAIIGVRTTIPFHQNLLQNPDFLAGRYATNFLARNKNLQDVVPVEV
ncbi:MAG: acetyl-CoA carboxylase biotin carboxylase subunit [Candidatus Sumerlaeia bacterium]